MKKQLSILAMLALPACMGGGSDSGVDLTPSSPDVAMNSDFGTLLNGVRIGAGEAAVSYDGRIGQAVQIHANDMFTDGYTSILIPGEVNGAGLPKDIGDLVTEQGYSWSTILQLVAEGDFTLDEALTALDNAGACGGGAQDPCITDDRFEHFGIAKAGSGVDQKWALVLAEEN